MLIQQPLPQLRSKWLSICARIGDEDAWRNANVRACVPDRRHTGPLCEAIGIPFVYSSISIPESFPLAQPLPRHALLHRVRTHTEMPVWSGIPGIQRSSASRPRHFHLPIPITGAKFVSQQCAFSSSAHRAALSDYLWVLLAGRRGLDECGRSANQDIMLVDRSITSTQNKSIVDRLGEDFTFKRWQVLNVRKIFHTSKYSAYPAIESSSRTDFENWVRITYVIHRLNGSGRTAR